MKKLFGLLAAGLVAGGIYFASCLPCIASSNDVSEEDYARMAQELVEQSIEPTEAERETGCHAACG